MNGGSCTEQACPATTATDLTDTTSKLSFRWRGGLFLLFGLLLGLLSLFGLSLGVILGERWCFLGAHVRKIIARLGCELCLLVHMHTHTHAHAVRQDREMRVRWLESFQRVQIK